MLRVDDQRRRHSYDFSTHQPQQSNFLLRDVVWKVDYRFQSHDMCYRGKADSCATRTCFNNFALVLEGSTFVGLLENPLGDTVLVASERVHILRFCLQSQSSDVDLCPTCF